MATKWVRKPNPLYVALTDEEAAAFRHRVEERLETLHAVMGRWLGVLRMLDMRNELRTEPWLIERTAEIAASFRADANDYRADMGEENEHTIDFDQDASMVESVLAKLRAALP